MATLSQNINQAISDFDSIKTAIQGKGVSVPSRTPTSQYASKINSIQTGITPTGTVQITQNGTTDVTNYASANVAVPQPSGTINITQNGTVDVTQYASVNVNVSASGSALAGLIEGTLVSVSIPGGVTEIRDCCFSEFYDLETVNFPSSLTDIRPGSFANCEKLTSINLLNTSLQNIGYDAFRGCTLLTAVYLPDCVGEIGDNCFNESGLTDIYFAGTQAEWSQITIEQDAVPTGVTVHYNYSPS